MTSAKFSDFWIPPVRIFTQPPLLNSLTLSAFPGPPSPLECGRHIWKLPYFIAYLRSRSRSRSPRPPGLPPSPSERERELRRLERDTLRIGPAAADAATAAAAATVSEVDLRAVLDIGRKAKEAVATGLVRNLKNAAARTLQSRQQQQQQQQHQAPPDSHHGDALSHQHYRGGCRMPIQEKI